MSDDPISVHDSLLGVVRALRPDDHGEIDISAMGGVFERWTEAVGEAMAAHVRPLRLDGTRLLVEVDEPTWAVQVKFFTAMIRARLAEVAGARVDTLTVRVRPGT